MTEKKHLAFEKLYTTMPDNPDNPKGVRDYFQKIIDVMPNNVYWLDRECTMLGCNHNTLKLVGLSSLDEFVGKTYEELEKIANWKEGQGASFKKDDMEVMTTNRPKYNVEEPPLFDKDGNPAYYLTTRVPLHDDQNNVIGVVGISVDITELKKTQMDLLEAKEKAEEANELKTMFMENMSHDFRTPMNGIYTVIQLFQMRINELPEDMRALVDAESKSVLRLKKLVESILDYNKLEAGKIEIHHESVDLLSIIESVVQNLSSQINSKNLNVIIHYSTEIPRDLISDSYGVTKIILNLLSNAVKFTEQGQITIAVELLSQQDNKVNLEIKVEDTGRGIPAAQLEHIFDRFYRLERSNKGLTEGYGIGLAEVKELVDKLNGEINVNSLLGKGTVFTIKLPFEIPDTTVVLSSWAKQHSDVRIIVCDDKENDTIVEHMRGDHVSLVESKQIINVLLAAARNKEPYRIVIIDEDITALNPLELIRITKLITEISPMLWLLSSKPRDKAWLHAARAAGYLDFILKPILPTDLEKKLTEVWNKWQKDNF